LALSFSFFSKEEQRGNVLVPLPGGSQKITELVLSFDLYEGVRTLYV
jgi:hypothetical protein